VLSLSLSLSSLSVSFSGRGGSLLTLELGLELDNCGGAPPRFHPGGFCTAPTRGGRPLLLCKLPPYAPPALPGFPRLGRFPRGGGTVPTVGGPKSATRFMFRMPRAVPSSGSTGARPVPARALLLALVLAPLELAPATPAPAPTSRLGPAEPPCRGP
jgi:hypothetical protein